MRRAGATFLLALFGFLLAAPVLFGGADSHLPACCRRLGLHHCAMPAALSWGPAFQAAPCPSFPTPGVVLARTGARLHRTWHAELSAPAVPVIAKVQTDPLYRVSVSHSHQQRGPPAQIS